VSRQVASKVRRASAWLGLGLTVLLAGEITARVDDRLRLGVPLLAVPDHDRDLVQHDEFGIHGKPNGRFKKWRLNQYGFRGPDIALVAPAGCARIMVLGASETFGLYESPGMEYPAQLQSLLRPTGCFEVVNTAVAGLTLRGLEVLWANWASRFKPDVVILYPTPAFYLANNPPGYPKPSSTTATAEAPPWWTPRLMQRAHDVIHIPEFIQRHRDAAHLAALRAGQPAGWAFPGVPDDRLQQFHDDLDRLVGAIAVTGALPVLVTHANAFGPVLSQADKDDLGNVLGFTPRASEGIWRDFEARTAEATVEVAAARAVPVVDARNKLSGQRALFADATHFTDAGSRAMAGLLAEHIAHDPDIRRRLAGRSRADKADALPEAAR
jgi:hypothetical protein